MTCAYLRDPSGGLAPADLIRDMTSLHQRLVTYIETRRYVHDLEELDKLRGFADKLSDAINELRD